MIRSIWDAFVARLRRTEAADDADAESAFVPSPLDLSVREAHGGHDVGVERELARIRDRAAEIEADERDT